MKRKMRRRRKRRRQRGGEGSREWGSGRGGEEVNWN
jgi:hypothetical protein